MRKTHLLLTVAAAGLSLLALACKNGDTPGPEEKTAPKLVSTNPASGIKDVTVPDLTVTFTYDKDIRPVSESQKSHIKLEPEAKVSAISTSGAVFTVKLGSLSKGKDYTLTLPKGLISDENYNLSDEVVFKFTTVPEDPKPEPELPQDPDPDPIFTNPIPTNVAAITEMIGLGINLGNQLDAHVNGVASETSWGNKKATQAFFTSVAKAGFKTVRIPVTWMGDFGEGPDYTIKAEKLDRVYEVVGYAHSAGLQAIINMHHDGANGEYWLDIKGCSNSASKQEATVAQIKALWGQIAAKFADCGDWLMFESFNEIQDGGWGYGDNTKDGGKQYKCLQEWNQAFVDVVRAAGENNASRYLIVPAYSAAAQLAIDNIDYMKFNDVIEDHIIIDIHCYDPYNYTLECKYNEWGHTRSTNKDLSELNEQAITWYMNNVRKNLLEKGIPVVIGELGCSFRSSYSDFHIYYSEYFLKACKTYGLPCIVWGNGSTELGKECHGYFDHNTGALLNYADQVLDAILDGYFQDEETLSTVWYKAPPKK